MTLSIQPENRNIGIYSAAPEPTKREKEQDLVFSYQTSGNILVKRKQYSAVSNLLNRIYVNSSRLYLLDIRRYRNLTLLSEFSELQANWDGDEASPINQKSLKTAKAIILGLEKQVSVVPTCEGSVLFEDKRENDYLSVEVYEDKIEIMKIENMDINKVKVLRAEKNIVETAIRALDSFVLE